MLGSFLAASSGQKEDLYIKIIFTLFLLSSTFEDSLLRPVAMVSRRKILSRSRDDLNLDSDGRGRGSGPGDDDGGGEGANQMFRNNNFIEQEDVWFHKDKLYSVSNLNELKLE